MRLIDRSAHTSRWRHVPTGEKLALSLSAMLVAVLSASLAVKLLILTLMAGLALLSAGIALRDYLAAFAVPAGFIATGVAAQALTLSFSGGPAIGLADRDTLLIATGFAVTGLASVSALLLLALTTPLTRLIAWMERRGLNPHIADIALVMFRMIWLTLDCLESGERALKGRLGHRNLRGILTSHGLLLAALLPRVFSRAARLETGLAARGYEGRLLFLSTEEPSRVMRMAATVSAFAGLLLLGRLA